MGSNWLSTLSQSYHPVLTYPGAGGGPTLCLVNLMSFVFPSLRARSGRRPVLCKEHTNTATGVANAACTSSDELDPNQSLQQLFVRVWSRIYVKNSTLNISERGPPAASSDSEVLTLASQDASYWDFCMRRIRLRHHTAAHDHRHSSTDFQAMRGRMRMCTRDATDAATAFKLQASTQASATYIASMAVPAPSCMLVGITGSISAKNKDCHNGRLARSRERSLLALVNSVGSD